MKKLRTAAVVIVAMTLQSGVAEADAASRLLQLLAVPGVSGHEQPVRAEIEMHGLSKRKPNSPAPRFLP